eukprot:scaffold248400_cov37-Cyclotella_meneghiniana.AAC.2
MHPSPVYRIIYCGVLSTPPSSITDNRRVDNSLVGCDAVLRVSLIVRRGGKEGVTAAAVVPT